MGAGGCIERTLWNYCFSSMRRGVVVGFGLFPFSSVGLLFFGWVVAVACYSVNFLWGFWVGFTLFWVGFAVGHLFSCVELV